MHQSEGRLSTSSSFIRRRNIELSNFLVNEMGMQPVLADTFLALHKPSTLLQTLALFVVNEEGFANHYFIPPDQPELDKCRVCEEKASKHIEQNNKLVLDQLEHSAHNSEILTEEKLQEKEIPKQTCQICYSEVIEEDLLKIGEERHPICLLCTEGYLHQEISNMRVEGLGCPHCGVHISNELMSELVDLPTYNKYRQFLRNIQIQKNPNLKWCPNSKCSVVISTNPKKKTSKCPKCATLICNRCNREAHPKSSCEGAFKKEIKNWQNASGIQKCKKCHGLVEKVAGCNHMTCSVCHYEWCWLCGSEYSTTHFSPLNPFGCPGLQDRPRDDWGKCKITLLRIGILLLIVTAFPVILPVAMVGVGPAMVIQLLYDNWMPYGCCKQTGVVLLGIVVGLLANPVVWIGCIVYFIPKSISRLCEWYRQRREQQQRRNSFLQEKLLSEQIFEQPGIE